MMTQPRPRQLPTAPSFDVMEMLRQHVPLTVLVDLAFPSVVPSRTPSRRLGVERGA